MGVSQNEAHEGGRQRGEEPVRQEMMLLMKRSSQYVAPMRQTFAAFTFAYFIVGPRTQRPSATSELLFSEGMQIGLTKWPIFFRTPIKECKTFSDMSGPSPSVIAAIVAEGSSPSSTVDLVQHLSSEHGITTVAASLMFPDYNTGLSSTDVRRTVTPIRHDVGAILASLMKLTDPRQMLGEVLCITSVMLERDPAFFQKPFNNLDGFRFAGLFHGAFWTIFIDIVGTNRTKAWSFLTEVCPFECEQVLVLQGMFLHVMGHAALYAAYVEDQNPTPQCSTSGTCVPLLTISHRPFTRNQLAVAEDICNAALSIRQKNGCFDGLYDAYMVSNQPNDVRASGGIWPGQCGVALHKRWCYARAFFSSSFTPDMCFVSSDRAECAAAAAIAYYAKVHLSSLRMQNRHSELTDASLYYYLGNVKGPAKPINSTSPVLEFCRQFDLDGDDFLSCLDAAYESVSSAASPSHDKYSKAISFHGGHLPRLVCAEALGPGMDDLRSKCEKAFTTDLYDLW